MYLSIRCLSKDGNKFFKSCNYIFYADLDEYLFEQALMTKAGGVVFQNKAYFHIHILIHFILWLILNIGVQIYALHSQHTF